MKFLPNNPSSTAVGTPAISRDLASRCRAPRICWQSIVSFAQPTIVGVAGRTVALSLTGLLALSGTGRAASATWLGAADAIWANDANWSAAPAPGTGDTATFNDVGNGNTTLDLGAGVTIGTVVFDTAAVGAYTIGVGGPGAQTLTLGTAAAITMNATVASNELFNANLNLGIIAGAQAFTFSNDSAANSLTIAGGVSTLQTGAKTLTVTGAGNSTMGGIISNGAGTLALTKAGTGILTLTGANTYTGVTTISAGTLRLGDGVTDGTIAGASIVNNATLAYNRVGTITYAGVISGTGAVTKAGTGTQIFTGANTYTGATTVNAGVLQLGNANAVQNSTVTVTAANGLTFGTGIGTFRVGSLAGGGNLALADTGAGAITLSVGANNAVSTTYSGVLSGAGALTKVGTGTLILTGAETYTGLTTISAGILQLGDGVTDGTIGGASILNNATLAYNRVGTITFGGSIGGTGAVTKAGAGTQILTGTNTYTGATTISAGSLRLGSTNAAQNSTMTISVANGLTFNPGIGTFNVGGLAGASPEALADTGAAAITLSAGANNAATIYSGILSGAGGLTKVGTGTMTLTGANTYTGATTISAGTLQLGDGTTGNDGSIAGASIVNNATLTYNRFGTITYGGVISGTGAITKIGAGTQILAGANTYTGATTITVGALQLGNADAAAGSTVTVGIANGLTFSPGIGSFNVGALAGAVNEALADTGAGAVALSSGANNASTTFSGILSGAGSLIKVGTGVLTLTAANTYAGGTTVAGGILDFRNTAAKPAAGTTTVGPAGTLALGVGAAGFFTATDVDALFANTLAGVNMDAAAGVGIDTTAATFTYATSQSAARALTKLGVNTLILTGTNTYTGVTTISAGTLQLGDGVTDGSIGGASIVNNATLAYNRAGTITYSGVISGTGAVTKTGNGRQVLTGTNTYTGGTTITAGTIELGNANAAQNSVVTITAANGLVFSPGIGTFNVGGLAGAGNEALADTGGAAVTLSTGASNASPTYSGILSGTGGLTKVGTGTLTLSGANTYTGATAVTGGTLSLTSSLTGSNIATSGSGGVTQSAAGSITGAGVTFTQGSTGTSILAGTNTYDGGTSITNGILDFRSTAAKSASGTVTVGAAGTIGLGVGGAGFFSLADINALFANTLTGVSADAVSGVGIDTTAGNFTFSTNQGGARSLTKLGANTLTLSGTNSYTGATTIAAGTVSISASANLGASSSGLIFNGGGLQITGTAITNLATLGHAVTFNAAQPVSLDIRNSANTFTLDQTLNQTTGGFTKSGAGTVVLNGAAANTYTGTTTLAGGTLRLDFANLATPTNLIAPTSALQLSGGRLEIVGKANAATSQTFASAGFNAGTTVISAATASGAVLPTVNLGALTFQHGGAVRFDGPATTDGVNNVAATAMITTTSAGGGDHGLLRGTLYTGTNPSAAGYATVGLYDWATTSLADGTAGTAPYSIVGGSQVANFYKTAYSAGGNFDMLANQTAASSGFSDTVRFNTPTATTFTGNANLVVGGFLVTPRFGAVNAVIGGTAGWQVVRNTGSTADQQEGVIWQNNVLGYLNVNPALVDGRDVNDINRFVKAGDGTVFFLATASGYRGNTYVNGGNLVITANGSVGSLTTAAPVVLNGGTLVGNATFTLDNTGSNQRPVTLLETGGGLAATAGFALTVNGLVTGPITAPLVIGIPASAANGNIAGLLPGSGPGTANLTAVNATGTVALTGANQYLGGTIVKSGTLLINGIFALGGANYGGVTLDGGTLRYVSGFSGNGTGDLTTAGAATLRVGTGGGALDTNSNNVTFANAITGTAGSGTLTIADSAAAKGTLTLSGTSVISGAVNVSAGNTLAVTGGLNAASGIVVAGRLSGTGIVGPVSLEAGGFLSSGLAASGNIGNLTTGALTYDGGSFEIGVGDGVTHGGIFTSGATFNTVPTFQYTITGTPASGSSYPIISSTSPFSDPNGFLASLPTTTLGRLTLTPALSGNNSIVLTLAGTQANLRWNNSSPATGNGTDWDITTNQNWFNASSSAVDKYFDGDNVTFDDANNGHYAVTLNTTVSPGLLMINNSAGDYGISGTGLIAGLTQLIKNGSRRLTLATPNTYSGGTIINAGTLALGVASGLLTTGAVTVQGSGVFDLAGNSQTIVNLLDGGVATGSVTSSTGTPTLTINNIAATSFSGLVSGSLGLSIIGSSPVSLSGVNTYTGLTTLTGGSLNALTNSAFGDSASPTGGLLLNPTTGAVNVNFTSAAPAIASLASSGGGASTLTLGNGAAATTLSVGGGLTTTVFGGVIRNANTGGGAIGNLNIAGGSLTLTGANTFTGTTTINAGAALVVGIANALQSSTVDLSNGALSFGAITTATFGSLSGTNPAQSLALSNTSATAVALTVGGNNTVGSYVGGLTGNGSIIKNGSAVLTFTNASYTGTTLVNQGTLTIGGASNLIGTIDISTNNGNANLIVQDNAVVNLTAQLRVASNDATAGGATGANGSAGTLTVAGNANVTAPTLSIGNLNRPTAGTAVTVQDTATLTINGSFNILNLIAGTTSGGNLLLSTVNLNGGTLAVNNFTLPGGGNGTQTSAFNFAGGTLKALASDSTPLFFDASTRLTARVQAGGAKFDTNGFNVTVAQPLVSGVAADGGLTKSGVGTLTLTGTNTYLGATTINGGALQLGSGLTGADGTISTSASIVNNATLIYNRFATTPTYAGVISGSGNLQKLGVGSQTLTGANTYTGTTTVDAGALIVSGRIVGSSTTVNTGGTLGGGGSVTAVDNVTLASGAFLAPGNILTPTTGTLTVNATQFDISGAATPTAAAAFRFELGTSSDLVNVATGSLNIGTGVLEIDDFAFTNSGGFGGSGTYTLFQSSTLVGTLGANVTGTFFGFDSTLEIVGNNLVLQVVPEPSVWLSIVGGVGMLLGLRRRRLA